MKLPAEILSDAEVRALLAACSPRWLSGRRNRALLVMLWRAGLRIGEALALQPKDLDPEAGTVTVLRGKGGRRRVVGLDEQAFDVLKQWLSMRNNHLNGNAETAPVFCTRNGGAIDASYVRTLLPRLARKAGIAKRTHAHGLRHLCACQMASEGIPVDVIRDTLGHSNLSTTDTYLRRLSPERVITAMRGRSW